MKISGKTATSKVTAHLIGLALSFAFCATCTQQARSATSNGRATDSCEAYPAEYDVIGVKSEVAAQTKTRIIAGGQAVITLLLQRVVSSAETGHNRVSWILHVVHGSRPPMRPLGIVFLKSEVVLVDDIRGGQALRLLPFRPRPAQQGDCLGLPCALEGILLPLFTDAYLRDEIAQYPSSPLRDIASAEAVMRLIDTVNLLRLKIIGTSNTSEVLFSSAELLPLKCMIRKHWFDK